MAEFEVTGVRYQMGVNQSIEKLTELAMSYISQLPKGTPMLLVAEPDNIVDADAVAVYTSEFRKVGYIKHESCRHLKPLLNTTPWLEAQVSGNDGHVTFFIEVPDIPEQHLNTQPTQQRILPESPLPAGIVLPFTDKERKLQMVASMLCNLEISAENITRFIELAEHYLPLSRLSLTREDDHWRDMMLKKLRNAQLLDLPEAQKKRLEQMNAELKSTMGDFHYAHVRWQPKVFNDQLMVLRRQANDKDGLFERFDNYIEQGTIVAADIEKQLREWFKSMPHADLQNYTNHPCLSIMLSYLGVSRQELYDVYAALLLLERIDEQKKALQTIDPEVVIYQLEPIFWGEREEAEKFYQRIKGMKPVEITNLVKKLVRDKIISDMSYHRDLWKVLNEAGLYPRTESNWNSQVDKS
ncbi:MAG: hypothetical protein J5875_00995 [Paludibacteraceae bacterium]|nr:hypothetical protein [Paludibacteraceae bacterium]